MEYGVTDRILLASDFPSGTIDNVIAGLRSVNRVAEGTAFPTIPEAIQDAIIHDNWKRCFPEWAEAWGEA
jgi:hypothetical protein